MSEKKVPTPEEIQKEFEDFVRNRFGGSVQVFTQSLGDSPHQQGAPHDVPGEEPKPDIFNFNMKPREVKAYLDRFVIKQEEAKKALSIAVCDHYNQIARQRRHPDTEFEYAKQNVLLLGPTGVGKTYLIKQIAKLIGVPFVKADATRFSETGYVGSNVDDLIKDLVNQAGGDIEAAQYGIIYLDEADKLASAPGVGRDVSGRGVQFGMLKLMEETEVDLTAGNDPRSQMQALMEMQRKGRIDRKVVNTRNILFIVSGAFSGLDDIIKRRLEHNAIGFGSGFNRERQSEDIFSYAATQDFVDYGFEPEFIGRLPIRVACHNLSRNDLFDVLKNSEGSILRQYIDAFGDYGIKLSFEDAALAQISALAEREKTGARALVTICENVLRDYKFELPSSSVRELTVTPELVSNPSDVLEAILADPHQGVFVHQKEIDDYFERFRMTNRITLSLSPEGTRAVAAEASRRKVVIEELLDELLSGYEHGLALIRQTTGQDSFTLGPSLVDNPKRTLERMVTECFQPRKPVQLNGSEGHTTH